MDSHIKDTVSVTIVLLMIILIIVELLKLSELRFKVIKSRTYSNQPNFLNPFPKNAPHFIKDICDF